MTTPHFDHLPTVGGDAVSSTPLAGLTALNISGPVVEEDVEFSFDGQPRAPLDAPSPRVAGPGGEAPAGQAAPWFAATYMSSMRSVSTASSLPSPRRSPRSTRPDFLDSRQLSVVTRMSTLEGVETPMPVSPGSAFGSTLPSILGAGTSAAALGSDGGTTPGSRSAFPSSLLLEPEVVGGVLEWQDSDSTVERRQPSTSSSEASAPSSASGRRTRPAVEVSLMQLLRRTESASSLAVGTSNAYRCGDSDDDDRLSVGTDEELEDGEDLLSLLGGPRSECGGRGSRRNSRRGTRTSFDFGVTDLDLAITWGPDGERPTTTTTLPPALRRVKTYAPDRLHEVKEQAGRAGIGAPRHRVGSARRLTPRSLPSLSTQTSDVSGADSTGSSAGGGSSGSSGADDGSVLSGVGGHVRSVPSPAHSHRAIPTRPATTTPVPPRRHRNRPSPRAALGHRRTTLTGEAGAGRGGVGVGLDAGTGGGAAASPSAPSPRTPTAPSAASTGGSAPVRHSRHKGRRYVMAQQQAAVEVQG